MTRKRERKLHIQLWVRYDPNHDVVGSRKYCPISNRIRESDPNICRVDVKRTKSPVGVEGVIIAFSRLDTDQRYYYWGPSEAARFVTTFDSGKAPRSFMLELTDDDLLDDPPIMHYLGRTITLDPGSGGSFQTTWR
jgi:hypothetical protein